MVKILAIGNSFSQDATTYLYDIAAADNTEIKVVNLYIGGCSLKTHMENVKEDKANYMFQLNGKETDNYISIKEALLSDDWDVVTMQQASPDSGIIESYFPYIEELSDYVKKLAPKAKQFIHQTWAYDHDSNHEAFVNYNNNQETMYKAIKQAYSFVAEKMNLPLILCGDIIQSLRNFDEFNTLKGGTSLCRDGYHMHLIYGRYATAAAWYETLLNKSILNNSFLPPSDEEVDLEKINLVKKTVHKICNN